MPDTPEYLTQEKYNELVKELLHLKTVKRKEVAESLEYAKSLGDLSENAEYQEARELQANIEDRISKLETMLQTTVIVKMHHSEVIGIGSTVTIQKEGASTKAVYKIVGSEEADLAKGKLSINSPLGHAMIGKKEGDTFSAKTPGGLVKYEVVHIE
ncbi:MAG: transcription elongation factor GreA [bacterium]|nr:transcription elongation factor GreA [bacterium]